MKTLRFLSFVVGAFIAYAGVAQAAIRTEWIDYKQGETTLSGYLAYDDAATGKRPGVLLVHSRAGMSPTSTLKDAEMIAGLGYVVFAEDIFGKDVLPKSNGEAAALSAKYNADRPLMRARSQAGFDVLRQNARVDATKIGVVGYCFGGTVAVELAELGVPIQGMVSVHGSFRNFAPDAAKNIKGRVLILHGAEDPVAPLEEVNKLIGDLRAAKVNWELQLFSGTEHGFTNPKNAAEERADREYKVAMARFFKEIFGS